MSKTGIPCMWMRGGTSKGAYFLASDLPTAVEQRNQCLLRVMGSPDPRQIDGIGGADPLTSKVAVVQPSTRPGIDIDYLFLQVSVDVAQVSDSQNCGNLLAGVAPFAIERGLVEATSDKTSVRIYMENTGQTAVVTVATPDGVVTYEGDAQIDGVPGHASPITITFEDTAGATCGALLPTGNVVDLIDQIPVTCIDNGMPVVILKASDLGIEGNETREQLEHNDRLKSQLESIRLKAGHMMNLGDVSHKTVPKMTLVSAARQGGAIQTRTFIPHRCHASIGVLGAVSVASACILSGAPIAELAHVPEGTPKTMPIEHPIGEMTVVLEIGEYGEMKQAAILRTARKLFDGVVFC